jgi:hypothetical protein
MMPWQVWCATHLALPCTRKLPYFLLIPGRFSVVLKGLSHEMDFAFDDMYG